MWKGLERNNTEFFKPPRRSVSLHIIINTIHKMNKNEQPNNNNNKIEITTFLQAYFKNLEWGLILLAKVINTSIFCKT